MSKIESFTKSPPILIPKIKKVNIPLSPSEYFELVYKQYIEEQLARLKYFGETFYIDYEDDSNNVYTDDIDICDNTYFSPVSSEHLEDDDFTLTTFNFSTKNDCIQ